MDEIFLVKQNGPERIDSGRRCRVDLILSGRGRRAIKNKNN